MIISQVLLLNFLVENYVIFKIWSHLLISYRRMWNNFDLIIIASIEDNSKRNENVQFIIILLIIKNPYNINLCTVNCVKFSLTIYYLLISYYRESLLMQFNRIKDIFCYINVISTIYIILLYLSSRCTIYGIVLLHDLLFNFIVTYCVIYCMFIILPFLLHLSDITFCWIERASARRD